MLLDVVHRVSNRHSYHRINSPSAAVTTSLLFTLSFCPRAICREARQGRYFAPRLNSKGTSYFQRKRGYHNLSNISSFCMKSGCSKNRCPFLPLWTLVCSSSHKTQLSLGRPIQTQSCVPALLRTRLLCKQAFLVSSPKDLIARSNTTGRISDLAEPQKKLGLNARTVPFFRTERTVRENKRRDLSPEVQSPSQSPRELRPGTREENRSRRV